MTSNLAELFFLSKSGNLCSIVKSYPEFPKNSSTTPRQIHLSSIPSPILEIDDRSMEPHHFTLV